MTKHSFWPLFRNTQHESFIEKNITLVFKKAGIWPSNGSDILKTILQRPVTPPKTSIRLLIRLKTPVTSKSIRHLKNAYKKEPSQDKVDLLFKATERLAVQHAIDDITKKGLYKALQVEKKKRLCRKKLGLTSKEVSGPQFYSLAKIQAVREFQAAKEEKAQAEKATKDAKKAASAAQKQKKEAEKAERSLQSKIRKDEEGQVEAEKKTEKETRIQAKVKARFTKPVPKKKATVKPRAKKTATRPKKTIPVFEEPAKEVGSLEPCNRQATPRRLGEVTAGGITIQQRSLQQRKWKYIEDRMYIGTSGRV